MSQHTEVRVEHLIYSNGLLGNQGQDMAMVELRHIEAM